MEGEDIPLREQVRGPSCTLDSERKQENHNLSQTSALIERRIFEEMYLSSTVERRAQNVVILGEPSGVTSAQPPLGKPCNGEQREDGRVDTDAKPSDIIAARYFSIKMRDWV